MVNKVNILESEKLKSWKPRLKYFIGAAIFILLVIAVVLVVLLNKSPDEPTSKSPNNTDDDLIFAHTICRHGARNSYEPYPNDPYRDEDLYWPEGYAQLTKVGKQQHFALGQYLRQRYAKLLGNGDYSVDKVLIYSTDTDRTLMSAQACLASLFAPRGKQIWNPKLNWQPIPVHTVPRRKDYLVAPEKPCDRYEYEMIQYTNSSEYKAYFEQNQALIKDLEEKTGAPLDTLTKLNFLYDTFVIEKSIGKRIPAWAEEVLKPGSAFEHLALVYFAIFTKSVEMKKLRSGYLLGEILERSEQKIASTLSPDRSLSMYFGHDNALADMLSSLGLYELHTPPFASCLFFELYKPFNSTGNYLQLFYRNSTTATNIPPLEIPNCGSKCPLNKWIELYKDILPTKTYEEECKLLNGEFLPQNGNPEHFVL